MITVSLETVMVVEIVLKIKFSLNSREFIDQITGRSGYWIIQLQFITSASISNLPNFP
jgi:hypothetical protein